MGDFLRRAGGKLALGLVGGGALFGYKVYQRGESATETRAEMLKLCEDDANCKVVVEKHFEACHEEAYKLGGKRRASGLDSDQLTRCINTAAGEKVFTTDSE